MTRAKRKAQKGTDLLLKLLFALGNPGDRYRDTRHNAGRWLADHLVERWRLGAFRSTDGSESVEGIAEGQVVRVVKPRGYMNLSGRMLPGLLADTPVQHGQDLLVLVDDVSLPAGSFRIRGRGSDGGHNGLASVEEALGSREYARLRIGVGAPPSDEIDLAEWVLHPPSGSEEHLMLESFDRMAEAIELWMADGVESAMNKFN